MYLVSVTQQCEADQRTVQQICSLKMLHWPFDLEAQLAWWRQNSDPDDLLVQLYRQSNLAAFLRIRARKVVISSDNFDALCVTEVCVAPNRQHQGVGHRLMQAASDIVVRRPDCIGYLLCRESQRGFYEKCGWSCVQEPIVIRSNSGDERPIAQGEYCCVLDPGSSIHDRLTVIGDVF